MALNTPNSTDLTTTGDGDAAPSPIIIPDQGASDELLREFGMEEHPRGGFHGLLEVIPTKADWLLDLIRANSLWPLLSGLSCCAIEVPGMVVIGVFLAILLVGELYAWRKGDLRWH